MSKFKVYLINPPMTVEEIYGKYSRLASFQPPIGLCALAAYLRKNNCSVEIIDAAVLNLSLEEIVFLLSKNEAGLIGIYANTANFHVAKELAGRIKTVMPKAWLVVGGPHSTFLPQEVMMTTAFDFCVLDEGEETLLELACHLSQASCDFSSILGLSYKDSQGKVCLNPRRPFIQDLDSLPFPAIDLLPDLRKYKLYLLHYKRLPYMTVVSTRGCPYRCVFCNTPFGKTLRAHSAEYVVDYMEFLSTRFGVKEICFSDDAFTAVESRVFDICEGIQKRNIDCSWYANTHANIKDRTIFKAMKKAGCWIVAAGVESGDSGILKRIGKSSTLNAIRETCDAIIKARLVLKAFFIIGSPGETFDTIDKTIKFSQKIKAHYPVFSLMTPYPGTQLWEEAEKFGSFDKKQFRKLIISTADPVFVPFGFTKKELLDKQKEAFRKAYLNFPMIVRQILTIDSFSELLKKIKACLFFLKNCLKREL
ncbi:MAG: radical SAM protein [Candidatus Omnitrophica bacterium]|nr:radical SAM protein [Candidatus Omnitrophota bacterium]